jgi:hypothetical protein
VNLTTHYDEIKYFAEKWRLTEGRLKFLLSGGSVVDALHELFSLVCALAKFFLQRYLDTQPQDPDYITFDGFMDEEAKRSPVLARLRALIEYTLLTKALHDSMRQGMLSLVLLLLGQLVEICAAAGKWKYMRLGKSALQVHTTKTNLNIPADTDFRFLMEQDHHRFYDSGKDDVRCRPGFPSRLHVHRHGLSFPRERRADRDLPLALCEAGSGAPKWNGPFQGH